MLRGSALLCVAALRCARGRLLIGRQHGNTHPVRLVLLAAYLDVGGWDSESAFALCQQGIGVGLGVGRGALAVDKRGGT